MSIVQGDNVCEDANKISPEDDQEENRYITVEELFIKLFSSPYTHDVTLSLYSPMEKELNQVSLNKINLTYQRSSFKTVIDARLILIMLLWVYKCKQIIIFNLRDLSACEESDSSLYILISREADPWFGSSFFF